MRTTRAFRFGAAAAGVGLAAYALHRSTHPSDARIIGSLDVPLPDERFDMPEGIVEHHVRTRDGGTVHALETGTGRPLVMLHGVTLRADLWAPQFNGLAERFRMVAVDLRGHGGSVPGEGGFGLSRLGDDLEDLLVALDLRDAIVVGHSMGGMTLMTFCVDHPATLAERVAGTVYLDTVAHQVFPPLLDRPLRRLIARGSAHVAAGGSMPAGGSAPVWLARLAFGARPSRRAVEIVAEMGASMDPAWMLASLDQMFDHDVRAGLARVRTPTVVVVGSRDLLTPVPADRRVARLVAGSELVVLERAGHQVMQERPDELAEILVAFSERLATSPGGRSHDGK